MPSIINSLLIGIFGQLYKRISMRLVMTENHRYVGSMEDSMINKTYIFQFVNTYISNFVYIFFDQDFKRLQMNMITIMVFKQVLFTLLGYF